MHCYKENNNNNNDDDDNSPLPNWLFQLKGNKNILHITKLGKTVEKSVEICLNRVPQKLWWPTKIAV